MKRSSSLLVLLALLGTLAGVQVAGAAASPPTASFGHPTLRDAAGFEEGPEAEEEETGEEAGEFEFEFEACEAADEEVAFEGDEEELEDEELEASCAGEDAEEEEKVTKAAPNGAPFVTAPVACQVRQAESTIVTLPGSSRVRLNVRYRTYAPTEVSVSLKLRDRKGTVAIDHATKHLGTKGALHLTVKLGAGMMERALAAREFDVTLRAPETPGFCAGALEQRLHGARHTGARMPRVYAD